MVLADIETEEVESVIDVSDVSLFQTEFDSDVFRKPLGNDRHELLCLLLVLHVTMKSSA